MRFVSTVFRKNKISDFPLRCSRAHSGRRSGGEIRNGKNGQGKDTFQDFRKAGKRKGFCV